MERFILILLEFVLLIAPLTYFGVQLIKKRTVDMFNPILVFPIAFSLFYFWPHLYYALVRDTRIFVDSPDLALVTLAYSIIALISFYVTYVLTMHFLRNTKWSLQKQQKLHKGVMPYVIIAFSVIGLFSLILFGLKTGGLLYYITHLNLTISLTKGKMYFVWGILLFRTSFLLHFIYVLSMHKSLRSLPNPLKKLLLLHGVTTALIVAIIGSRIIILSFIIELLVFTYYMVYRFSFKLVFLVATTSFALFVIVFGAWRNYGWQQDKGIDISFAKFLRIELTERLGVRLFENYFDSTKNFAYVVKYTDNGIPIQYGRTYLALLVQPIPSKYRPIITLPLDESMKPLRSRGGDYRGIDPLLGELYKNLLGYGIVFGLGLMGVFYAVAYKMLVVNNVDKRSPAMYMIYGILVYSLFFWLRGAFVGHTSIILMDLLPLVFVTSIVKLNNEHFN